jgi:hypothetical protein
MKKEDDQQKALSESLDQYANSVNKVVASAPEKKPHQPYQPKLEPLPALASIPPLQGQ